MRPGGALPSERALQEQLGISRFSLREGLARLSALGIIDVRHGKGSVVTEEINGSSLAGVLTPLFATNDLRVLEDLFAARSMLETETARLAAIRRTDKDLVSLREILWMSERTLTKVEIFGKLDFEFHYEIARIADNVLFLKMHEAISEQAQAFLKDLAGEQWHCEAAFKGHCEIFECIEGRSPREAEKATRAHLLTCKENYVSSFQSFIQPAVEQTPR